MNKRQDILDIDPDRIDFTDVEIVKQLFLKLLNAYANAMNKISTQDEIIQKLKDEINQLKGEKGKPDVKPNKNDDYENEEESDDPKNTNKKKGKRNRKPKKPDIKIDREEVLSFSDEEMGDLPPDIEFKGYRDVTVQEIKIVTDNVKFLIPRYWSASQNKSYGHNLPKQYSLGEFGANIYAFVLMLYFIGRVPENKIVTILQEIGILISNTKILNIINGNEEAFSEEKMDILNAGLKTTKYHQTDDTGIRVEAKNCYMNVYCNPYYTAYIINDNKRRETIQKLFDELESTIHILLADDAPQFKKTTEKLALCWVHEERHYKKLNPLLTFQKKKLEDFRDKIWKYYGMLAMYKEKPTIKQKIKLEKEFDNIFGTVTGYDELDYRIRLTKAKKESLLVVLDHPEVPLHNNGSEQEIREPVIKRKVSNGLRSEKGKLAWENHFTIQRTCRKQGISYWHYMKNKFGGVEQEDLAQRVAASVTT